MRKLRLGLLAGLLLLAGCGTGNPVKKDGHSIVVTVFPEYEWVSAVLGDNPADVEVTILEESGADLHSYQPTAQDVMKIADCDLFVYVGGESDRWVTDALKESVNPNQKVISLLDVLGEGAKREEYVEGMETEDDGEEPELDEHVWLSLRSSEVLVKEIGKAIGELDPENRQVYETNTADYTAKIEQLDEQYRTVVSEAAYDTLIFGDRFPFRYLADDYGLNYYAAFSGCSGETEASFETILFLAGKMDELQLPHIMKIEGSDGKIARTVIENTKAGNADILTLNSMQGITGADIKNGVTYLQIMNENLQVLNDALN